MLASLHEWFEKEAGLRRNAPALALSLFFLLMLPEPRLSGVCPEGTACAWHGEAPRGGLAVAPASGRALVDSDSAHAYAAASVLISQVETRGVIGLAREPAYTAHLEMLRELGTPSVHPRKDEFGALVLALYLRTSPRPQLRRVLEEKGIGAFVGASQRVVGMIYALAATEGLEAERFSLFARYETDSSIVQRRQLANRAVDAAPRLGYARIVRALISTNFAKHEFWRFRSSPFVDLALGQAESDLRVAARAHAVERLCFSRPLKSAAAQSSDPSGTMRAARIISNLLDERSLALRRGRRCPDCDPARDECVIVSRAREVASLCDTSTVGRELRLVLTLNSAEHLAESRQFARAGWRSSAAIRRLVELGALVTQLRAHDRTAAKKIEAHVFEENDVFARMGVLSELAVVSAFGRRPGLR